MKYISLQTWVLFWTRPVALRISNRTVSKLDLFPSSDVKEGRFLIDLRDEKRNAWSEAGVALTHPRRLIILFKCPNHLIHTPLLLLYQLPLLVTSVYSHCIHGQALTIQPLLSGKASPLPLFSSFVLFWIWTNRPKGVFEVLGAINMNDDMPGTLKSAAVRQDVIWLMNSKEITTRWDFIQEQIKGPWKSLSV